MIPSHRVLGSNAPPLPPNAPDRLEHQTTAASHSAAAAMQQADTPTDAASDSEGGEGSDSSYEEPSRTSASKPRISRLSSDQAHAAGGQRADRHAHHERLRALTVDPSSTFVAKYRDRQTGRVFERRERIREAILPEEYEDYVAWRGEAGQAEQRRKKQYLDRPRKEISKKSGQEGKEVWSRELDDAYQTAIRRVPPLLGKKKLKVPNERGGYSLHGRNMLISRVIYLLTGQTRLRKQISSHNQVMWNFPRKLPYARYAGSLDTGKKNSRYARIFDTSQLAWDEENARIVVTRGPPKTGSVPQGLSLPEPLQTRSCSGPLHPHRKAVMVRSFDFSMLRYAPTTEDPYLSKEPEHRYTTMQSATGAHPQLLEDVQDWRTLYPGLASLDESSQLQDIDIILFEMTISVGQPPRPGSRLYITYDMDLYCEAEEQGWTMVTSFYENEGGRKVESTKRKVKGKRTSATQTQLTDMPFGSLRWIEVFTGIMKQKASLAWKEEEKIVQAGHGNCASVCGECQRLRHDAQSSLDAYEQQLSDSILRDITVMQELFTDDGAGGVRRTAVFLWKARRASPGEAATTVWRKLSAPPARNEVISPPPFTNHPPMTLDSEVMLFSQLSPTDNQMYAQVADSHDSSWDMSWGGTFSREQHFSMEASCEMSSHLQLAQTYTQSGPSEARRSQDSGYWSHGNAYSATSSAMEIDASTVLASFHSTHSYCADAGIAYSYEPSNSAAIGFDSISYYDMPSATSPAHLFHTHRHQQSTGASAHSGTSYSHRPTNPRLMSLGQSHAHPSLTSASPAATPPVLGSTPGAAHQKSHSFGSSHRSDDDFYRTIQPLHAPQPLRAGAQAAAPGMPLLAESAGSSSGSAVATPQPAAAEGDDGAIMHRRQLLDAGYGSCFSRAGSRAAAGLWGGTDAYPDLAAAAGFFSDIEAVLGAGAGAGPQLSWARAQQGSRVLGGAALVVAASKGAGVARAAQASTEDQAVGAE